MKFGESPAFFSAHVDSVRYYVSLTRPPQAFDNNEIVPCGDRVMPIKNLIVLWCLYDDQVSDLASKFEGISMNTSYKADGLPAT